MQVDRGDAGRPGVADPAEQPPRPDGDPRGDPGGDGLQVGAVVADAVHPDQRHRAAAPVGPPVAGLAPAVGPGDLVDPAGHRSHEGAPAAGEHVRRRVAAVLAVGGPAAGHRVPVPHRGGRRCRAWPDRGGGGGGASVVAGGAAAPPAGGGSPDPEQPAPARARSRARSSDLAGRRRRSMGGTLCPGGRGRQPAVALVGGRPYSCKLAIDATWSQLVPARKGRARAHPRRVHRRPDVAGRRGRRRRRGSGSACAAPATTLEERQVPLAGLVAAFVFAVQMLNFPVAGGTSGHLLGGVLAAVLVGPCGGRAVRGGGPARAGPAVRRRRPHRPRPQHRQHGPRHRLRRLRASSSLLRRVLPRDHDRRWSSPPASPPGSSVVLASLAFAVEYAVGRHRRRLGRHGRRGHGRRPHADRHRRGDHHRPHRRRRAGVRPDLVYGARDLRRPPLVARPGAGRAGEGGVRDRAAVRPRRLFLAAGLLVAVGAGLLRQPRGQREPDGLEQGGHRRGLRRPTPGPRTSPTAHGRLRGRGRRRRAAEHRPGRRSSASASRSRVAGWRCSLARPGRGAGGDRPAGRPERR